MTATLQRRFDVTKDLPLLFLGAALVPVVILLIIELSRTRRCSSSR